MGRVPRILQENLCQLMDLLTAKNYLAHPQILIGGIGDATCDRAPLQIGQFESGIEIDEDLAKLWLEGGGGGQQTESYELAMHFMARHTAIDCLEKRGRRGYLFLIGDEMPYRFVKRREVAAILGEQIDGNIPVDRVLRELEEKYRVYFVIPNLSSYYNDPTIYRCWTDLLGERVIRLENPHAISELIAAVIGLNEGAADLTGISADLRQTGRGDMADIVCDALATMGRQFVPSARSVAHPAAAVAPHCDGHKPRWDFGFSYNSKRWQFVMRIARAAFADGPMKPPGGLSATSPISTKFWVDHALGPPYASK